MFPFLKTAILIITCLLLGLDADLGRTSAGDLNRTLDCSASILCPGEEFVYEVSWLKIPLGQIRLHTHESTISQGKVRHETSAHVDSYNLPFVDLHVVDQTRMDENFFSLGFRSVEKKDDRWLAERSTYDYANKLLVIEKVYQHERNSIPISKPTYDTVRLERIPVQDGLSILHYARANVRRGDTVTVPTVVYGKQGQTVFYFNGEPTHEEIDVLEDQKVRVIPLSGKAEFEGLFGLTGDFKGWFSNDNARVPIKAELKVLIGSVKVELASWKRNGWKPPAVNR